MKQTLPLPMEQLETLINYQFENKDLLRTALTHSSFSNESKDNPPNNERQEFLGDAVLSIIVSDFLYRNFHVTEGELTKIRAVLVCEQSLFEYAISIQLGSYLRLGHGERQNGGAERPSILADALEAVIAAIYLDSGIDEAHRFVIPLIEGKLQQGEDESFQDYKTTLQELVQKDPAAEIRYQLVEEYGPDHNKTFVVDLFLNDRTLGRGIGRSKKVAEQDAARKALELLEE